MRRGLLAPALAAVLIAVSAAPVAGASTVTIPGLSGPGLTILGSGRTASGGGVLVAESAGTVSTAELQADGALQLSYGTAGVSTLALGAGFVPTAFALDPSTGAAWIGGRSGTLSQVVAVGADGALGRIETLARTGTPGIAALAWHGGQLLVAFGSAPGCQGCTAKLLDAASGQVLAARQLTSAVAGGPGCPAASVTSGVIASSGTVLLGTAVAHSGHCSATVVRLSPRLSTAPRPRVHRGAAVLSTTVASTTTSVCTATRTARGIAAGPYGAATPHLLTGDPSATLTGLVALDGGACAALITGGRGGATTVAQTDQSSAPTTSAHLAAGLAAQSMFRCHQHLLVLATDGPTDNRGAVVVPVPVTRGPYVQAAAAHLTGTGCST